MLNNTDPTVQLSLFLGTFFSIMFISMIVLLILIPRSKYEFSTINTWIDSANIIISIVISIWLTVSLFN